MLINGKALQDSNTDQMVFKIPFLVSHISKIATLTPGDLIFTGTPAGVGTGRTPPIWLKHGDECVVEIEQLGSLRNKCISE